jgi:adenosine deaminase
MIEIGRTHNLDLPFNEIDHFRSLVQVRDGEPFTHQNFLSKFKTLRIFYQSPEVIQRVTRQAIADVAADNVRYFELRFTPMALAQIKNYKLEDTIDWVIESANQAAVDYCVMTRLIVSVNRHESLEIAEEVVKAATDRKHQGIVGLDLAGSEADFPAAPFIDLFREAKQDGLNLTIHAGEWGGPQNVVEAIEKFEADRIGHGVRVCEDPSAIALARERQTTFEVCPTSNYQSGVFSSLEEHPLLKMIEAGLVITINTDDPSISQIDLSDEYELARENLGLRTEQLRTCLLNAARAAFLPEGERAKLITSLSTEYEEKDNNN